MQRAEVPAEGLLIIQILQTGVRLIGRGHVHKSQANAGHDLQHKTKQRAAAEDIKPTAGTGWHGVPCSRFEELAQVQALINPQGDVSQHARFPFCTTALSAETLSCRLLKKISEARRTFLVIVSVKRDREICTSTTTNHKHELERGGRLQRSI